MAILIVITFITVNIGKIAKDKTYTANAADASVLSAASVMAYAFNYVANANAGESQKNFKDNWKDIKKTYSEHFLHAKSTIYESLYKTASETAKNQSCGGICGPSCSTITGMAYDEANRAADKAQSYRNQMNELIKDGFHSADSQENQKGQEYGVVPNGASLQQAELEAVRERVHDDQDGANDLYQNALYIGYIYNFTNSGISPRLGKINQKLYSAFLKSITPQSIRNGEMKTFSWVDGAGRFHVVSAVVNIQPARTYDLETTQMDRDEVNKKLQRAKRLSAGGMTEVPSGLAGTLTGENGLSGEQFSDLFPGGLNGESAKSLAKKAADQYSQASKCCACCTPCIFPCGKCSGCPPCCPGYEKAGGTLMRGADALMAFASNMEAMPTWWGLNASKPKTTQNKDGSEPYIIKHIKDIQHDRLVHAYNFQFHMGGPVKGMRGDVDVPTFYPPVQSSAVASFDGGDIEQGRASHDSKLVSF